MALAKKAVATFPIDSPEHQYAEVLTPYAFDYVHKQLSLRCKVHLQAAATNCKEYTVYSSNGELKVTCDTCMCLFWASMHLPCHHMFAVREKCGLPLFDSSLALERWTNDYMRVAFMSKRELSDDCGSSVEVK